MHELFLRLPCLSFLSLLILIQEMGCCSSKSNDNINDQASNRNSVINSRVNQQGKKDLFLFLHKFFINTQLLK